MSSRVRRPFRSAVRGRLFLVLLLPVALTAAHPQADAPGDDPAVLLLNGALEQWRSHETISARFAQVQNFAGFDDPLHSTGRLRILRPYYFELKFDPPHRQLQVCDGQWIWTYVEETAQVFKSPLGPDTGRGADLLDWALEGASVLPGVHQDSLLGVPARRIDLQPGQNLPLQELHVWVDARSTPALIGYEAVDTEGNRTRMRLVEVEAAVDLEPSDFQFAPPEGVEVIDLGAPE